MACCQNFLIHFEAQLINNFALLTNTATALTQYLGDRGLSKRTTSPSVFLGLESPQTCGFRPFQTTKHLGVDSWCRWFSIT